MLRKFTVKNFKSFRNKTTLDLCHPCNYEFNQEAIKANCVKDSIIYGFNGCGKSNLALAIFDIIIHTTDKERRNDKYSTLYINLDSSTSVAEFSYEFAFDDDIVVYNYGKKGAYNLTYESLLINNKEVLHYDFRDNEGFTSLKVIGVENVQLVSPNPVSRVKAVRSLLLDVNDPVNKIYLKFIDFVDRMLMFYSLDDRGYQGFVSGDDNITRGIIRANKTNEFQKFLNSQGLDFDLVEKEINGQKELFCKFKKGEASFMSVASTGTKSLALFYYWYIVMSKASFVFIDEFDAFYHFELSEYLVNILKQLPNTQVILTTHNTDLLSNDILRPDCYFILEDNNITSLHNRTNKDLRKAHNLQKMFKAGSFDE